MCKIMKYMSNVLLKKESDIRLGMKKEAKNKDKWRNQGEVWAKLGAGKRLWMPLEEVCSEGSGTVTQRDRGLEVASCFGSRAQSATHVRITTNHSRNTNELGNRDMEPSPVRGPVTEEISEEGNFWGRKPRTISYPLVPLPLQRTALRHGLL